jgi:hypothetical protein
MSWLKHRPLVLSVGLPETLGKVVVPASSDHMQDQILAALQALKVSSWLVVLSIPIFLMENLNHRRIFK